MSDLLDLLTALAVTALVLATPLAMIVVAAQVAHERLHRFSPEDDAEHHRPGR